jgi:hypothetical protein
MKYGRPARSVFLAFLAASALISIAFGACGRKTDVKPPELVAPEIVASVTARNAPKGIKVAWARPRVYADGSAMRDLAGFRVERSHGEEAWTPITNVTVIDRDRFRQLRRFEHLDADVQVGDRYRYRVFAFTIDGHTSVASEIAEVVRAIPEDDGSGAETDEKEPKSE